MLSMTPSLLVKNASRMKDTTLDPKAIGEALGVKSVLTGTVRQAGSQLRVTVKLVDTKTEANIWAKTKKQYVLKQILCIISTKYYECLLIFRVCLEVFQSFGIV